MTHAKYVLCLPYSISGLEVTGADEGQCFALEAVLEMIVESLKWMQALDFQQDNTSDIFIEVSSSSPRLWVLHGQH